MSVDCSALDGMAWAWRASAKGAAPLERVAVRVADIVVGDWAGDWLVDGCLFDWRDV